MDVTEQVTAAAVAVGLVAGLAGLLVARRPDAPSSSVMVWAAIAGAAASVVAVVVVLAVVAADVFALAHVVYLIGVIAVPIVGVAFAVGWWRQRDRRPLAVAAVLLLVPVPLGLWATHVAPYRLRLDRAELVLPPGRVLDRPLRVGVLADLQTVGIGRHERKAIAGLMAEQPDVILIAGDFFQGSAAQLEAARPAYRELLGDLEAPGGVFAVRGDVDGPGLDQLLEGTGVELLDDEVRATEVRGHEVVLGGVRLDYSSPSAARVYDQLEAIADDAPVLLLAHRPDAVLELAPGSRVDLTVAGHTHGGQIALPLAGPLITMTSVPREVAAGGLHEVGGNAIYVSSGVGMERAHAPQIRFLTRPSYGVVDVRPAPD